jgi:hypothetical protein
VARGGYEMQSKTITVADEKCGPEAVTVRFELQRSP